MTPEELRAWRDGTGFSVYALAEILRIEPNVLEDWEDGKQPIPQWLRQALEEVSESQHSTSPVCYMTSLDWQKREQ